MAAEDGEVFIRSLAQFVRTHEKALANALQSRRPPSRAVVSHHHEASPTQTSFPGSSSAPSATSSLASALSLGAFGLASSSVKPAKLTLTSHHLYYLLAKFEELSIEVGPMNIRLENIHTDISPANYVSFLSQPSKPKGRSDKDSIHSVSSVRSVMSNMSSFWSAFRLGPSDSVAKTERARMQLQADLKYLYSSFTKIPCLRLSPDRRARLIKGYEEFPFDTAVPLNSFKNVSVLEICDVDFRQFFGWDRLAEQLRSLTIKRGSVDDPADLLIYVVLDDMEKRRKRSSKTQGPPTPGWPATPSIRTVEMVRSNTAPDSSVMAESFGKSLSPRNSLYQRGEFEIAISQNPRARDKSASPTRRPRRGSSYRRIPQTGPMKRSGSGSSESSAHSPARPARNRSSSNFFTYSILSASKWRFLHTLSLADNGMTSLIASSLAPVANTLRSLDLSSNLFTEIPDCLASLTALRALNLSNNMIASLHSVAKNPLPAISALNLRANRLISIAGIERLLSLERLDLRENKINDPTEMARLTGIPEIREIYISNNPLIRSHSNYRVTIFNLFRATPGYVEDIVIDGAAPGYNERRQLQERAEEAESVPVVKPAPTELAASKSVDEDATPRKILQSIVIVEAARQRPVPHITQSEVAVGSGRRKKGGRRKIVDLSADDNGSIKSVEKVAPQLRFQLQPQQLVGQATKPLPDLPARSLEAVFAELSSQDRLSGVNNDERLPDIDLASSTDELRVQTKPDMASLLEDDPFIETPALTTPVPELEERQLELELSQETPRVKPVQLLLQAEQQQLETPLGSLADELQALDLSGDAYRRKIEALKEEFGTGWLTVLNQDGLDGHRDDVKRLLLLRPGLRPDIRSDMRPDLTALRTASQGMGVGIASGGRTIG